MFLFTINEYVDKYFLGHFLRGASGKRGWDHNWQCSGVAQDGAQKRPYVVPEI